MPAILILAAILAVLSPGELPPPRAAADLPDEQFLTLALLPPARLNEVQCAGYGQWLARARRGYPGAPSETEAELLAGEVARRVGGDAGISPQSMRVLVDQYAIELADRVAGSGEGGTALVAARIAQCGALFRSVRAARGSASIEGLTAAGRPSPVNRGLATCYAHFMLAARATSGDEALRNRRSADRARLLALAGKAGPKLAEGEAALAAQLTAATHGYDLKEDEVLRFLFCQPMLLAVPRPAGS